MSTWSDAEDLKVARKWCIHEMTTREIADDLEKTKSSVYRRIKKLGLRGHKGDRMAFERFTGVSLEPAIKPVRVEPLEIPDVDHSETRFSTLIWGDTHFPFEDSAAVDILYQIASDLQPRELICLGDVFDMYEISDLRSDPSVRFDDLNVQSETIEPGVRHLATMRQLTGAERAVFLAGNHEERWERLLDKMSNDTNLRQLLKIPKIREALDFKEVIGFDELGYEYVTYGESDSFVVLRDLLVVAHGHKTNKYASRSMLDDFGKSVLFGHTHRIQSFTRRDLKGQEAGWNVGCLCNDMHYRNVSKECQGFAVVEWKKLDGDWIFNVEQVRIHSGRAIWRGNAYVAS